MSSCAEKSAKRSTAFWTGRNLTLRPSRSRIQHLHGEIQEAIAKAVILKYTPKLHFALDSSIEAGDKVLDLLSKLPPIADDTPAPEGSPDTDETDPA